VGAWLHLAELTPASRNRYVDLLRAIAITCVVLGHWTMAAPWIRDGHATIEHLLTIVPWTRWLTWCFQVMPVFFFVGGFSNGTSWRSAQRRELPWRDWFASRLQRLLGPTLVLVAFWVVGSMIALPLGVHPEFVRVGSQISLIPTWFLAVYILVCMVVPWTHAWWQRSGYASVAVLVAGAIVMDALFFLVPSLRWLTWANYLFIWLAVHQLGYAWLDGLRGGGRSLVWGLASLGALFAMVLLGPWPISLVGVPGETLPGTDVVLSNTRPPKLPLLALAGLVSAVAVWTQGEVGAVVTLDSDIDLSTFYDGDGALQSASVDRTDTRIETATSTTTVLHTDIDIDYRLDPLGRRIERASPTETVRWLYADALNPTAELDQDPSPAERRASRRAWAKLIRRIFETDPLLCDCGAQMKIIAVITEPGVVDSILRHLERHGATPARDPPS